ncbi:MAG: AMIN domain-containing protein [Gemmatimonadota bacterium]|nr:AMIN domain-containing protein [Gemmatimonadota bacterium]
MTRHFMSAPVRRLVACLGVIALVAVSPLRADERATSAEVTAVSVLPTPGYAELVIALRGAADVRDFVLRSPDRLVIDIVGATLQRSGTAYDGLRRGAIRDVRFSQFRPDVVRVVIQLDAATDYSLERSGDEVRIRFGSDQSFLAWSSAAPSELVPPRAAARNVIAPEPEVAVPAEPAAVLTTAMAAPAPRITVTWDKATIADVVVGFAAFSGRTIILGKDIKGEVTAEVKNQPWTEAFAAVLATQGLQATELPGGIIRVDTPAALAALDSTEPTITRMIPINYASASQLLPSVKSILTKRGAVVSDTTTNSLIVTETRTRMNEVQDFVKNLDVRTPQVSIQAKIIFVDRTNVEALGLKYDIGSSEGPFFNKVVQRIDPSTGELFDDKNFVSVGGEGVAAVANADGLITQPALDLVWSTAIGGFRFTSFLQALQRVDLADVQAEPSITTVDNREAVIKVGEDVPVRIIDFASSGSGSSVPKATVSFKETGILLRVTPHVTNNRQVLMQLEAERSNVRFLSSLDAGFTVQKQNAKNQLLVNDGETAVIGGLTVTEVSKVRSGLPFLSQLPVIGKLFGFTTNTENRKDLIILVTPRILDENE